jgi:hypothetical protein
MKAVKLTIEVECADELDPNVVAAHVNGLLAFGLEFNRENLRGGGASKRVEREAGSIKVVDGSVRVAGSMPRVLVVVKGGIADPVSDEGVDVEVFDWDNYTDAPDETGGVPAHFSDLAKPAGIPVEEVTHRVKGPSWIPKPSS